MNVVHNFVVWLLNISAYLCKDSNEVRVVHSSSYQNKQTNEHFIWIGANCLIAISNCCHCVDDKETRLHIDLKLISVWFIKSFDPIDFSRERTCQDVHRTENLKQHKEYYNKSKETRDVSISWYHKVFEHNIKAIEDESKSQQVKWK